MIYPLFCGIAVLILTFGPINPHSEVGSGQVSGLLHIANGGCASGSGIPRRTGQEARPVCRKTVCRADEWQPRVAHRLGSDPYQNGRRCDRSKCGLRRGQHHQRKATKTKPDSLCALDTTLGLLGFMDNDVNSSMIPKECRVPFFPDTERKYVKSSRCEGLDLK
jgi:hypothetical protein